MMTPTTSDAPAQAGPPADYVPCPNGCGRWTFKSSSEPQDSCWHCIDPSGRQNAASYSKDWMPPLAPPVPAPHVDRRAGQRWRCEWNGQSVDATIIGYISLLGTWPMDNDDSWNDARWTGKGSIYSTCTMTLLSDAPATSERGRAVTIACAEGCGRSKHNDNGADTWICEQCSAKYAAQSKPAQEAAKAEPKCSFAPPPGNLHGGAVLRRTFVARNDVGKEVSRRFACDSCYMFEEEMTFGLGGPSVLHDDKHPARLPRPKLTHSMGAEDPALPEAR